jgi:hypothetical protein
VKKTAIFPISLRHTLYDDGNHKAWAAVRISGRRDENIRIAHDSGVQVRADRRIIKVNEELRKIAEHQAQEG